MWGMSRVDLLQKCAVLLALSGAILAGGCSKDEAEAEEKRAAPAAAVAVSHEGQGESLSTDPPLQFTLQIDQKPVTINSKVLMFFELNPEQADKPQPFELEGEQMMVVGRLPQGVKVSPGTRFADLVGQTLEVRTRGGEPGFGKMSKIALPDGTVYRVERGTMTVEKAFYRGGKYAGVSGKGELVLQQIKLGDTDDPNNKGDEPVGEAKKVPVSFTVPAQSVPFLRL